MDIENIPAVEFSSLVGEHALDGVDMDTAQVKRWYGDAMEAANVIRFRLDGKVYMAVEDPDDGYRSTMKKLILCDEPIKNAFQPCRVLARLNDKGDYHANDTLELIDVVTGKVVLRVGTDNSDDYYPWFVAEWTPENMAVNRG
jgi:hypothetical protein